MKHCCWYVFSHAFVSLFKREPASKLDAAGSACRCSCLYQALKSWVWRVPFWYSGLELQLPPPPPTPPPPPLPFILKRHWGKQDFLLRCHWLPFTEWEPSPGLLFFCTSCSNCQCKVCRCASPEPRLRAELGSMHGPVTRRAAWGGKAGPVSAVAFWRWPQQSSAAWVRGSSLTKALGCACYKQNLQKDRLHMELW